MRLDYQILLKLPPPNVTGWIRPWLKLCVTRFGKAKGGHDEKVAVQHKNAECCRTRFLKTLNSHRFGFLISNRSQCNKMVPDYCLATFSNAYEQLFLSACPSAVVVELSEFVADHRVRNLLLREGNNFTSTLCNLLVLFKVFLNQNFFWFPVAHFSKNIVFATSECE